MRAVSSDVGEGRLLWPATQVVQYPIQSCMVTKSEMWNGQVILLFDKSRSSSRVSPLRDFWRDQASPGILQPRATEMFRARACVWGDAVARYLEVQGLVTRGSQALG